MPAREPARRAPSPRAPAAPKGSSPATVRDAFRRVRLIRLPRDGFPVEETVGLETADELSPGARVERAERRPGRPPRGTFDVAVASPASARRLLGSGFRAPEGESWFAFRIGPDGSGSLLASRPGLLYAAFRHAAEDLADRPLPAGTLVRRAAFDVEKSTFDLHLTQYARTIRGFDRERYVREFARLGFSHIEVNALAGPFPAERGLPGEFYADFYTYCPALDQFASSRLNTGLYPRELLDANLAVLKENAGLAVRYGLAPGLLCFEPRTVPEELFQRYPTLRGARVDHPFRSFKPRYTLALAHPAVRRHYEELLTGLLREVPDLAFLSLWSNDSGSGFEHTKSLYAGRNGGAYLIREWKDDREIARAAAANVAGFFELLRDAGRRIRPGFRVITRLESFSGELEGLWPRLRDGIDVEANSLLASGWETNYPHPRYPDVPVLGSAYHNGLRGEERAKAAELAGRGSRALFYHFLAGHGSHEPLLGVPFPWLVHDKLRAAAGLGLRALAHMGGLHPPDKVPYAVNQEVFRAFQLDPEKDVEAIVLEAATRYAGRRQARALVRGWRLVETAIRRFVPLPLYSGFGTVWNRLLVRPLVPDIERIPEAERAYYEDFLVGSFHNPNKVDLARDVLFELVPKGYARTAFRRTDAGVWRPLDAAIRLFERKARETASQPAGRVFEDQLVRARALRGLLTTLRNTAVWAYAVHEFLDSRRAAVKRRCRALLRDMIDREIRNAREMLDLWMSAPVEWLTVSGTGETPFIYGDNFGRLLERKMALMARHRNDAPRVDPAYMFRLADDPYAPRKEETGA